MCHESSAGAPQEFGGAFTTTWRVLGFMLRVSLCSRPVEHIRKPCPFPAHLWPVGGSWLSVGVLVPAGLSALPSQGGLLGFHNGEELVFAESSWYVWTFLKRLWYYGLNHLRMSTWVEENLEKFMR